MADISPGAQETVRLAESGVGEEVILAYVENAQMPFDLEVEDIIYLNDLGISSEIVTAMLHRDAALREQGFPAGTTSTNVSDQKLDGPGTNVWPAASQPLYVTNAPQPVAYFYDSLTPYGTWVELEGYGWCWQPRVVVIDHFWRPYWQGGHWIYTDLGWYWHSDYSWGWAPFHYGRWHHHHRHGWVWFPDLVWAPAWVSWRFSDTHCGWAPLPLGAHFVIGHGWRFNHVSVGINFDFHLGPDLFTFVELRHLHERRPHLHAVPATEVKEIHNRTTVVNNYIVGSNNRIINQGVADDKVAAASRREIRPVTVRDVPAAPAGSIKREHLTKVGSTTVLERPKLKAPTRPAPTVAQRVDERHPIVTPMPQRPIATLAPRRASPPTVRPGAYATAPPATTTTPKRAETRPGTLPPTRAAPKGPEVRPSAPQPVPVQPAHPQPRGADPMQPALPGHLTPPPPRHESPRAREQRLSNGSPMQRPSAPPAATPSSRPAPPKPRTADDQRPVR